MSAYYTSLRALVDCEKTKIFRRKEYVVFPVLLILNAAAAAMVSLTTGAPPGDYSTGLLSMVRYVFVPPAVFFLAGDLISREIASGEIRVLLTRPVSRAKIFMAKQLTIFFYSGLLFGLGLLSSWFFSIFTMGLFSISLYKILSLYAKGLLVSSLSVSLSGLLACFAKTRIGCFCLCFLGSILYIMVASLFKGRGFLLTSFLSFFFAGEIIFLRKDY